MGGVSDRKRSSWPHVIHMPQVIKAVRSRINWNPVWKKKIIIIGNGYCFENCELHYQTKLGAFKLQTGQCLTVALKENWKKKSRCLLLYGKECYKEILFTDEKKNLLWRKLSISTSKEACKLVPGINPASVMVWWGMSYVSIISLHFVKRK